jgi:enoyl-CoA hydratase
MQYQTLSLSRRERLAELRLNRPDRANPIDRRLLDELDAACDELRDDAAVRAVLLTAEGDVFSHGWDTGEEPVIGREPPAFRCLELLPQPVIACIEGDAIGAGLELALACDVRIASDGAMFAMPDVEMQTIPHAGGTQRLPRIAGPGVAARMLLVGEPLDASAGLRCGLVNRVLPRADVRAAGEALARRIADMGPLAVRYAKEAIQRGVDMPLEQALRYETDLTVILQTTSDRAEGVRAFLEKRTPNFEGN